MNIHLASSTGIAKTKLAAFDNALFHAGIANYNLLLLSSVIPPESRLIVHQDGMIPSDIMPGTWGDRLYVVMAEHRASTPGEEAWAGIGWVQDEETGKGLFVEHEGVSEQEVRQDIQDSLQQLMATRKIDLGKIQMKVQGVKCEDAPVCAMVVAAYQASDWQNTPYLIKG